jgi:hypothetical protein
VALGLIALPRESGSESHAQLMPSDSGETIVIMNDEPQTPEELDAHFGPGGPVAVAQRFFEALYRAQSLRAAYKVMTPELRRDRTDAWVELNAAHPDLAKLDREALAERLSEPEPDDPLWPAFEASSLQDFAAGYSFIDPNSYGYASRPRPIGVDQELVLLVKDRNAPRVFDRPTLISGAQFVLEHRDGCWLVAGFSRAYSASQLLDQGQTRAEIVNQLVADGIKLTEAEEIFDRSLADEETESNS